MNHFSHFLREMKILQYEYLLVSFVLCHYNLNVFGVWTVDQTKQDLKTTP